MNVIGLTKGGNTMRNSDVIKAEISKLEAELADSVSHERMHATAVQIVRNLGWEWDNKLNQWRSPAKECNSATPDDNAAVQIKPRDWVRIDLGCTGVYGLVRAIEGPYAKVSYVSRVTPVGINVHKSIDMVHTAHLKVVSREEIVKNLM